MHTDNDDTYELSIVIVIIVIMVRMSITSNNKNTNAKVKVEVKGDDYGRWNNTKMKVTNLHMKMKMDNEIMHMEDKDRTKL